MNQELLNSAQDDVFDNYRVSFPQFLKAIQPKGELFRRRRPGIRNRNSDL